MHRGLIMQFIIGNILWSLKHNFSTCTHTCTCTYSVLTHTDVHVHVNACIWTMISLVPSSSSVGVGWLCASSPASRSEPWGWSSSSRPASVCRPLLQRESCHSSGDPLPLPPSLAPPAGRSVGHSDPWTPEVWHKHLKINHACIFIVSTIVLKDTSSSLN